MWSRGCPVRGGSMALSKGLLFRVIPPEGNCRISYGTSWNQGSVMQISWTTGVLSGRWSELYPFSRNKTQGTFLEHSLLLFQTGTCEFFYMIIGRSQDFKNKVLNNYKSCRTVKELASACDISLSAFKRQFSAEFGEAPAEWMQKQLLGEIKYKLSVTDLPLGTIANELEFSSLAHFSRFCKRCLGCSPRELRQQIKGG